MRSETGARVYPYCSAADVGKALEKFNIPWRIEDPLEEVNLRWKAAKDASALVEAITGRHFRAVPAEEDHYPIACKILLHHWPVHSVISVVEKSSGEPVEWEMLDDRIGEMHVYSNRPVVVSYHYNDPGDPVPSSVREATSFLAAWLLLYRRTSSSSLPDLDSFFSWVKDQGVPSMEVDSVRWTLIRYCHKGLFSKAAVLLRIIEGKPSSEEV